MSYYHFLISYKSGDKFEYAYEINISEEQVLEILAQIEAHLPRITFDGRTIFPIRIGIRRIFYSESFFPNNSDFLRRFYPSGYEGDFGGYEVTRNFLSKKELEKMIEKLLEPPKIDIDGLISSLIIEDDEKDWIVIVNEIVNRFGPDAIANIIEAIKKDPLTEPDDIGIISKHNSRKWNSLALTYMNNNYLQEAVDIFTELIKYEPNNPATQNNYGVSLLRFGKFSEAKVLFKRAYERDKERGPEVAKQLPAYKNLRILMKFPRAHERLGDARAMASPSYHNILFMDIAGFSRPTWYGRIQVEKISYLIDITRVILEELGLRAREMPSLHTGDGMALFFDHVEHPLQFAIKLTEHLIEYNSDLETDLQIELRIGIHAGDSFYVYDLSGHDNRCGPAINTARRIMDIAEPRNILCSHTYGDRIQLLFGPEFESLLHDCGTYKVKHEEEINIYNIFNDKVGNPECPLK